MMRTVPHSRRSRTGCSILALATVLALGPTPAVAQSFAGAGSFTSGTGSISTSPNTTSISVTSPQAVINWIPNDNAVNNGVPIVFQPANTTANFSGSGNYAVLNKIAVEDFSRVVELRGTIQSVSSGALIGTGSIYFYSPSGFLLAGSSVVNVGSAVFSALPITLDGSGNFIVGADRTVTFGTAEHATASITTDPNAQITATGLGNSYVAMVAPRVVHNGAISVDGSAALVAAEAATISFSPDGLFDIQVTAGTTDSEGLNVNGTVGGPSPTGSTDKQGIYLVAVPKNQLMTMVIGNGADLGFTLANSAVDDNGTIVLSAGHDIVGGEVNAKAAGHGTGTANLWFTGARARNNLFAEATGYADLYSNADQPTTVFDNDVTVHAAQSVSMGASGAATSLTVGGDLSLSADITGAAGQSVLAGDISLYAQDGGDVSVAGATTLSANATGGDAGVGTAGGGGGGTVWVSAENGGSLTLLSLTGTAFGTGGSGTADGANAGHGTGGELNMYAHTTGSVVANGAVSFDAKGTGGSASGAGLAGNGVGGGAYAYIGDDATITINGATSLKSDGQGGAHATGNGGSGTGGASRVTSVLDSTAGGLIRFNGNVELSSDGTGGASGGAGAGGTGTGGWARISTPDDHDVDLNGSANLHANGTGGASAAGDGGFGDGGRAEIESYIGGIDISGTADLFAEGLGGHSETPGKTAGDAIGGDVKIVANAGSSILFQGFVNAEADGQGGFIDLGANGGDGTGGTINVNADGAGAMITFAQGGDLFADGHGSIVDSVCSQCSGIGGNAQGGSVTFTGTSGGQIGSTGNMELSATGSGGSGGSGAAGNGVGGTVLVQAPTGVTMTFNGLLQLNASGDGGFSEGANAAGDGTGNSAQLHVDGGNVTVTGELELDADGFGGESQGGGNGGVGTGGRAIIRTTGSTAQLNVIGNVLIEADGTGGDSFNFNEGPSGNGGDGVGGRTRAVAQDGLIHVTGNLDMDATATGGTGASGGNATSITTPPINEAAEPAAFLWAGTAAAELRVDGLTDIDVSATGGTGFDGNGGGAAGGEIDIVSELGHVNLGNVLGNASATGGDGGNGGDGGDASGGDIDVAWSLTTGAVSGTISADSVNLSVSGQGGKGGDGVSADSGGDGGDGGNGAAGSALYMGNAAGGTLNGGAVIILAEGHGGDGGDGGSGDTGPGGNGGAGGSGAGGLAQTGTFNFGSNPGSGGTTTYTTVSQSTNATGGAGGNGGEGGGGLGLGGRGGDAAGGLAALTARGVLVSANSVSLFANATGGNGGSGSTAGDGGNATTGNVAVESKDRTGHPTQRGTLNVGSLSGTAIAQGGTGNVAGTSTVLGNNFFRLINGDANIGSLSFTIAGSLYNGAFGPDYIQAQDGLGIIGTFSYNTTGQLAIYTTSTGALTVGNLALSAGNFIDHPTLAGPANPGTISATNLSVTSGGNFFADANLNVTNGIGITVPGSIGFDNATSAAFVDLWAQGGSISLDDISAGSFVALDAGTTIATGIISGGEIDLNAVGNISFASANAATEIDFDTENGSVTGGNVVAGNQISGSAGGNVVLQNLTVSGAVQEGEDFSIGISAIGNISVGNVTAAGPAGFATQGNLLTGTIGAGDLFLALVGGNTTTGAITTSGEGGGQVYIADDSMFLTGGGQWDGDGDFIVSTVLELNPVRAGGSIAINGPVTTGLFQAAAGTSLTTGTINSGGGIGLDANGAITTGNLVAGDFVLANGGSITTGSIGADSVDMASTGGNITVNGDVTASGTVELDAFGNILTDNITAGTIDLAAGGSITTDNLTTELPLVLAQALLVPDVEGNITLIAGGNILTGDITAAENILLATPGTITGETIEAGNIFMALAHGDMSFGDATAVEVFLADFAMLVENGGGQGGATCVGNCGTSGADGVVTAPPSGSTYHYVTTEGGEAGAGQLPSEGGSNGSQYTTSAFSAAAGEDLEFWFNYVTSDGSGFADYAWAALLTSGFDPVAILFTARTQPSGTIVPGFDLPGVEATLNPATVPIIDGGPVWGPLGGSSGSCYAAGCGYTGWINSTYEIAQSGNYVVRFGVTNWSDTSLQSGMAFSGITIGGVPVESTLTPTHGSITIGKVDTDKMTAAAGTTLIAGIIDATDFVDLYSGGNMLTAAITAGTDLRAEAGGTMTLGALSANDIELDSVGNMSFVSATAGTEFDFSSDASVNGGNVTAGNQISGDADGSVTLANLTVTGSPQEGENFSIGITALGNITVGNVSGAGPVGFGAQGNLTTGNVAAGGLFLALVGGDTNINGTITTTGENSQVYLADYSMCETGGGCTEDVEGEDQDGNDFDPGIVLALDPVATGGAINITGAVSTGVFRAAAGTGFTAQAITADDVQVSAGGTATLHGNWNANSVTLSSNDISIAGSGGINANDTVTLVSTNATQTVIGDGVTGGNYALSNDEFGRVSGGNVVIVGRDTSSFVDMVIGDLSVTGPLAGSTIEGEGGVLVFAVGDLDTETASGVIRVVGDVNATGFGVDNAIEFHADRFELDAATGSISVPGGELGLYADRIHVAQGSILNQLAANPTYTGYQEDLNEAPATPQPGGVLIADTLWIESDNLQSILIQNTGTFQTRAGFLVRQAFVNEDFEVAGPAGSINLVVNGQVLSEGGTLTGVAARDALVDEETDITPFTSNSTINGCPLTGACIIAPPPPPPRADVVDDQIDLITGNPLGDGDFGNEDSIDDNEEGDGGANNPISPPQPLFDTRSLIPSGDVNDPVSGTGNPALLGSDSDCEIGEDGQCVVDQTNGDGQ